MINFNLELFAFFCSFIGNVNFQLLKDAECFEFTEEIKSAIDSNDKLKSKVESAGSGRYRILFSSLNFKVYVNQIQFLNSKMISDLKQDDIAIFDNIISNCLFYSKADFKVYNYNNKIVDTNIFKNSFAYVELLEFFNDLDKKNIGFIDYYNRDQREIIFTSPSKHGKLIIKYNAQIPIFSIDLSNLIKKFKSLFNDNQKDLPKFLKNQLFDFLKQIEENTRLTYLVENLDTIIEASEREYDAYILELSFESISNKYIQTKTEYFRKYSDLLSSISTKIAALPIVISAVAFAVYKLQESFLSLLFILVAYIIYSTYMTIVFRFYKTEAIELKDEFDKDIRDLSQHDYFQKHKNEIKHFEDYQTKISRKIIRIKNLILCFYILILSTSIFLICYILFHISETFITNIIFSLILFFINFAIVYYN